MNTRRALASVSACLVSGRDNPAYRSAIEWLHGFADYERKPAGHDFNLDRPRRLLRLLGEPQRAYRSAIIAGTKGKGSTAAMLQALLGAGGQKVGLYTQPHLHSYRERMRVGQQLSGQTEMATGVERLKPAVEELHRRWPELGRLTMYEVGTALALAYFADQGVDWAVLEVGLGGRLDAVNAVDSPLAVLTPISLDHTQVLGDTIERIAREKVAIIRASGTVISAPQPAEARSVIERACREHGATLHQVDPSMIEALRLRRFDPTTPLHELRGSSWLQFSMAPFGHGLKLPLGGAHQAENAATALLAARAGGASLEAAQVRSALGSVDWPGRLEVLAAEPIVVADGAHNGASAVHLAEALQAHFTWRQLILVLGTSTDKDLAAILAPLVPLATRVIATQAHHPRARAATEVAHEAAASGTPTTATHSVAEALDLARADVTSEDLVVASGSLFVVAEAREHLGWAKPSL